ncbi:glycosyltransferase [Ornithinicoccus hortensis]|uniref:Glycosyltransferase involved in cell wall biosynthesis n=1 Tax=Ornithinicoccus hortensis TaxID=82346 RepID=A0A542YMZ0_9MICO|nr:glycosyltransferase [Ornithinicoccus hortensis]TQL49399.1 glycosyltransferase involved in cell wall biosynthesis [Ornithinicoccus hortensis]
MRIKNVMRRLPPIAWRDAKLEERRRETQDLRARLERSREKAEKAAQQRDRLKDREKAREEARAAERAERARQRERSPKGWTPGVVADPEALVSGSGLFDPQWYLEQVGEPLPAGTDPLSHYLEVGQVAGLSPHPVFDVDSYVQLLAERRMVASSQNAPEGALLHYLTVGAARGVSGHPVVDTEEYLAAHPDAAEHPGSVLGHLVARAGTGEDPDPADADLPVWDRPDHFVAVSRQAARTLAGARGYLHLERDRAEWDAAAEAELKARLRADAPLPDPPAVVSVVIPTRDRAAMIGAALDSVLAQTYPHWQLVVVDDGSTDGTGEVLAGYATDDRIEVVRHEQGRGVAAARNAGLARATGHYVAYLDSDNTWAPDFLELVVRAMHHEGHRVAYAMSALVEEGGRERRLYRGMPFHRAALEERNYIDCIVLVHERSLLEETGGFDESLRRNVDWDLFIRLARVTDFGFVPFLATSYDVWETRNERITSDEPVGYRWVVRQRTLVDWADLAERLAERDPDLLSVVLVATEEPETVGTGVARLVETALGPVEVVVVDSRLSAADHLRLQFALAGVDGVQIERLTQPLPLETASNVGLAASRGGTVAFLPESVWTEPGWDAPLLEALDRHTVVQPLVLNSGGAVWSAGAAFLAGGHSVLPYHGFAGDAPEVRQERAVTAVTALGLVARAADLVRVEGFNPLQTRHYAGTELSLRLTAGGGSAACVPASRLALRRDPTRHQGGTLVAGRDNRRRVRELWTAQDRRPDEGAGLGGYRLVGLQRAPATGVDGVPLVVHDRPERPLRWAIKIGPPGVERRTNWGDWHFAESMRDALERAGHEATVDCKDAWHRPTAHLDDVVLQLRGVAPYGTTPGQLNVAWVISHPERVSPAEMSDYDLVFGASPRWCRRTSDKLGRPVEVLLQCTDQHRFHPVPPDRRRAHPVLVVANGRPLRPNASDGEAGRPVVTAALQAGIVPSVYGLRWDDLLPEGAWKGEYLPNHELPGAYAAAGVVLNDHWGDMRDHGILSNRLFDLAACDARVVSDYLPEVAEVFGDVVHTYRTPEELAALVSASLHESPEAREARQELGRRVREEHTFDARAATLTDAVAQLRASSRVAVLK